MIRAAMMATLMLGGCATTTTRDAVPCNADAATGFVGRTYDASLEAELRRRTGAKTVRPVRPGQMVTMDFHADRLTVRIDAEGKVSGLSCG